MFSNAFLTSALQAQHDCLLLEKFHCEFADYRKMHRSVLCLDAALVFLEVLCFIMFFY